MNKETILLLKDILFRTREPLPQVVSNPTAISSNESTNKSSNKSTNKSSNVPSNRYFNFERMESKN